jgi:3-deoxy-D-manno-octulosonic acid kinase
VKLPPTYDLVHTGRVRAAIRRDLRPLLEPWLLAPRLVLPPDAEPFVGGRGGAFRVVLPGGQRAVVRLYRRGGVLARFVHDTYLAPGLGLGSGLGTRPLRELAVTAEVRRRGVATADVLAARVEGDVFYRGALLTAEIPSATTLIDALRRADPAARRVLAASAGRAIAGLHEAGVSHADLNMTNILVAPGPDGERIALVDFDRARLRDGALPTAARRRNLTRLARSLAKFDADGTLAGAEERRVFRSAYASAGTGEVPCAS